MEKIAEKWGLGGGLMWGPPEIGTPQNWGVFPDRNGGPGGVLHPHFLIEMGVPSQFLPRNGGPGGGGVLQPISSQK